MKKLALFLATVVAMVSCAKPFEPVLEVTAPESMEVLALGGTFTFGVKSNVPVAVTSTAPYVKITPNAIVPDNGATAETVVKVEVEANAAEEGREFDVKFTTTDYAPLDRTYHFTQAAAEYEKALEILSSDLKPFSGPIDASCEGAEVELVVNSTVSWIATSDVAWVTVDPQIGEVEGYVWTAKALKVTVAANEGEERSGKVTITPAPASGLAPVEVVVNQAEKPAPVPFTVDVKLVSVSEYVGQAVPQYPDATCRVSIMENPSKTVTSGYYGVWQSAAWTQAELDDPMEILLEYGNEMEADELAGLNGAAGADPCEWVWSSLNPDTEYVFVTGFVAEDGSTYTAYSKSTTDKDQAGSGDKAPADLLGKWICPSTKDRWGEDTYTNWTMTLTEVSNGIEIDGFDAGMEAIAAANKLTLKKPVAKWSAADKTLTIADSTPTGLAASGANVVWRGHAGGYYTATVYTYNAAAHTLSLSVDGFMAVAGQSAYSGFDAPLVFYKEGFVPSSVKPCGSVNKSVKRAAVKDLKNAAKVAAPKDFVTLR